MFGRSYDFSNEMTRFIVTTIHPPVEPIPDGYERGEWHNALESLAFAFIDAEGGPEYVTAERIAKFKESLTLSEIKRQVALIRNRVAA